MSDPYETRQPWKFWEEMQKETLDKLGFTDTWAIDQHREMIKKLSAANPRLFAKEIREHEMAILELKGDKKD